LWKEELSEFERSNIVTQASMQPHDLCVDPRRS